MAVAVMELAQVEQELAAAVRARPEQTRATTMNLICCAEDQADADWLADRLGVLARRHPGRMFLIVAGGLDEHQPRGEWRARILPLGEKEGEGGDCGELVELQAAGIALLAASNAVTPLLVGQAPVFLWWRCEDPVDNPRFDDLSRIADRVMFDSQSLAFEPARFLRLARRERSLHPGGGVCDLTWQRLARWRRLIAQGFDPPEAARELPRLERVKFTACASQTPLNGGALLLAGWLASRLGWTVGEARAEARIAMRTRQGGAVEIEFTTGGPGGPDQLLHSVELEAAALGVRVRRSGPAIRVEVGGGALGRSTASFPPPSCFDALAHELDAPETDPQFQQAWAAAAEMLAGLGVQAA